MRNKRREGHHSLSIAIQAPRPGEIERLAHPNNFHLHPNHRVAWVQSMRERRYRAPKNKGGKPTEDLLRRVEEENVTVDLTAPVNSLLSLPLVEIWL